MGKDAKGHGSNAKGAGQKYVDLTKGTNAVKKAVHGVLKAGHTSHDAITKRAGAPEYMVSNALQELRSEGKVTHKTAPGSLAVSWHLTPKSKASSSPVRSTTKNQKY